MNELEKWRDDTNYYNQSFTTKEACVLSLLVSIEEKLINS